MYIIYASLMYCTTTIPTAPRPPPPGKRVEKASPKMSY